MSVEPPQVRILILQHPQEPDHELGTARLIQEVLPTSVLKTGLSWANLKKALGSEAIPSRWGVLYLGSGVKGHLPPGRTVLVVDKKSVIVPDSDSILKNLEGIILLDGSWSQAKALWWRNAWLLKCRRLILNPKVPSLYGKKRKEPRAECLSTLESLSLVLDGIGESPSISQGLIERFKEMLGQKPGA